MKKLLNYSKNRLGISTRANKTFPKLEKCKFHQDNYEKSVILHHHKNNNRKTSCIKPQNPGFTMLLTNVLTQRIPCSFLSGHPNSCLYKKYI